MKVFLIVLLVLTALIVFVCLTSVTAQVSWWDREFTWCVKYLGIRILPSKKPAKPKEKKEKEKEEKEKELRKRFLMDKLWSVLQNIAEKADLAGSALAALPGPFQKLLMSITWCDIRTDIVIGGQDAADTAKQYGIVQAGVQTLISSAAHIIHVKRKDVRIGCDFIADQSQWNAACKVKVKIGPLLGAAIWLAWKFLMDSRRAKKTLVSDVL